MKKIILAIAIAAVAVLAGWSLLKVFQEVPLWGSSAKSVLDRPFKIGIVYQRHQAEVVEGMKAGMKELGYSNIIYNQKEVLVGPNMTEDAKKASKSILESGVDLVFSSLELQAKPALDVIKEAGSKIPLVFYTNFHDPADYGLVDSFQSPGGMATGVSLDVTTVIRKHLEFIKKISPQAQKIGIFGKGFMAEGPAVGDRYFEEFKKQAPDFGFRVIEYTTAAPPPETEKAFHEIAAKIKAGDIDVIYHIAGHPFNYQEVAEDHLAARLGILMFAPPEDLPNGGHIGYGGDFTAAGKQTSKIIDKIFQGTKLSDIPVEYLEKLELVTHPARADVAGVKFPESILNIVSRKIGE